MSCGNPHSTPCSEVLDRLYEYLDGELDTQRVHLIREHLEECAPCLREYGLEDALKSIVRRACCDQAPTDLRKKVMMRIQAVRVDVTTVDRTIVDVTAVDLTTEG
jgi:mycothiol system anti-sigma-R factor